MKFIILVIVLNFPEICPKFGLQINILNVILGSGKFTDEEKKIIMAKNFKMP